jgi:hypothetical protein
LGEECHKGEDRYSLEVVLLLVPKLKPLRHPRVEAWWRLKEKNLCHLQTAKSCPQVGRKRGKWEVVKSRNRKKCAWVGNSVTIKRRKLRRENGCV